MLARAKPILVHLPIGKPVMVEVGVFKGQMAEYLLACRQDLIWHGVDNWLSVEHQPETYKKTEDIHALATAEKQEQWRTMAYRAVAPFNGRAKIYEMPSVDAAEQFSDDSVDLVFVDADHSYTGCLSDLRAWWPKVKSGGWLSGHDYGNLDPRHRYGVNQAVDQFSTEMDVGFKLDAGHTYFMRKP
jgi:hypothetical protein